MLSYLVAAWLLVSGFVSSPDQDGLSILQQPDSVQARLYLERSNEALSVDLKLCDSLALLSFASASRSHHNLYLAKSALAISNVSRSKNARRCEQWADTALYYAGIAKDTLLLGKATRLKAVAMAKTGKFDQAFELYVQAKKYFETAHDTLRIIEALQGMSLLYHNEIKDYNLGLKYGFEALELSEKVNDPFQMWRSQNAVAINYDDMNNVEKALEFHYRNLKVNADSSFIAVTHNNIGNTLFKSGNFPVALKHFYTALRLHKSFDKPYSMNYNLATVHNNLSCIYAYMQNAKMSRLYRDSAVFYAHESGEPEKLLDAYRDGYLNSEINKDTKETIFFLKKYLALKDSLYTAEKAKIIYDFEFQYETQRKESEIALLKSNGEIKELEVQQSRFYIIIIITVFVLGALLSFVLYRRKIQANEIQRVKDREEFQRRQFSAVMEAEEKERSRVAKDLHDGIGQLLSVAKLSLTGLEADEQKNPLVNNAIQTIDEATAEVRNVSHNLMPTVLSTLGLVAGLRDFTEKLNRSGRINVQLHVEGIHTRLKDSVEIHIYRILQEITNNIIKHAEAEHISIHLSQHDQEIKIMVVNNGHPLSQDAIDKSTGLGWNSILSRIAILNGKMQLLSTLETGTRLQIQLMP